MSSLLPWCPNEILRIIIGEYFDDFAVGTVQCCIWNHVAWSFSTFQKHTKRQLRSRDDDDDEDLFPDSCYFDTSVNGTLAQLYRAGMSFFPRTVLRIAQHGGPLADWLARNFFLQLERPMNILKQKYAFFSNTNAMFQTVFTNIKKHQTTTTRKRCYLLIA